jgi:chemotaxis protein methyltransferase CheR
MQNLEPEYVYLKDLLKKTIGMELGVDKLYLIETRLAPLAMKEGFGSVKNLLEALRKGASSNPAKLFDDVIDLMTTHETLFFRDREPFEFMKRQIIPEWLASKINPVRIWSAACSTGQEPYSIVMSFEEAFAKGNLTGAKPRLEILATDISKPAIERASRGVFTSFEVQRGLTPAVRDRFFLQQDEGWKVKPEVRACVQFKVQNLFDRFEANGRFDVVFLRNVLIYFPVEDRRKILSRIHGMLQAGGYLFIGGAETVLGLCEGYSRVEGTTTSVYRKI